MKHLLHVTMALVALLGLMACTEDTIGISIVESTSSIIQDSSFVLTGKSIPYTRIQMRTPSKMLGELQANGFGHLTAEAVTQWMPAMTIDTTGTKADWIDSCRLKLRIPLKNGFTGDSLAPMRLNVYALNTQLTSPIYSDLDPSPYYSTDDLLATASYSPTAGWLETSSSDTVRAISIPMPVEMGRKIFNKYRENPKLFSSPSAFAEYMPGIYIQNSYGSGHVMNVQNVEFDVYYKQYAQLTDTTDTIYPAMSQCYMASTPEIISDNLIKLEVADDVKSMVNNGDALIVAPGGYEVQVRFPIQDIIDKYQANIGNNLAVINQLSLELPVEIPKTQYNIQPPKYLLMVKTSLKDTFINGDSLTNNKDSFYATYNSTTKKYTFSGLRDYILNIINNQGGIATESDINFTITPIDVTVYTYSSSSYYYYSTTTSSTVTKISPQVSSPAIAKLRLDKAKVKITYSKQVVN